MGGSPDLLALRFYKSLDYRAVGAALDLSDDAAQKRVSRALEKPREILSRGGIRASTASLSLPIAANAVQAAPAGLAVAISSATLASTATTSTIIAATKEKTMTTFQKSLVTATVAVLVGAEIYQARQTSQLREQVQTLQQRQAPLAKQNQELLLERDDLTRRLAAAAPLNCTTGQGRLEAMELRKSDQAEPKAEDSAFVFNEVQLVLAEKRTALSALRAGIAVFVLPISALSALIATSRYYDFLNVLHWMVPLLALNVALIVLGCYLIIHSIRRIHHYDRLIRDIKRKHSAIADLIV
jgi:hypothetical protein